MNWLNNPFATAGLAGVMAFIGGLLGSQQPAQTPATPAQPVQPAQPTQNNPAVPVWIWIAGGVLLLYLLLKR